MINTNSNYNTKQVMARFKVIQVDKEAGLKLTDNQREFLLKYKDVICNEVLSDDREHLKQLKEMIPQYQGTLKQAVAHNSPRQALLKRHLAIMILMAEEFEKRIATYERDLQSTPEEAVGRFENGEIQHDNISELIHMGDDIPDDKPTRLDN